MTTPWFDIEVMVASKFTIDSAVLLIFLADNSLMEARAFSIVSKFDFKLALVSLDAALLTIILKVKVA